MSIWCWPPSQSGLQVPITTYPLKSALDGNEEVWISDGGVVKRSSVLDVLVSQLTEGAITTEIAPLHWWNANHTVQSGGLVDTISDIGSTPLDFTQAGAARCPTAVDANGQTYLAFDGTTDFYQAGAVADWKFANDATPTTFAMIFARNGLAAASEALLGTNNGDSTKTGFSLFWTRASATDQGPYFSVERSTVGVEVVYFEITQLPSALQSYVFIVRTYGDVVPKPALGGVTPIVSACDGSVNLIRRAQSPKNGTFNYNNANPTNTLTLCRSAVSAAFFSGARVYDVLLDPKVWSDAQVELFYRYAASRVIL